MLDTNSSTTAADQARQSQMQSAWQAYFGRFPQPLSNRPRKQNDAVSLNYCRPIVDKGVSFLFGKDVRFIVPEDAPEGAQDWLNDAWAANKKMTTLQKLGINGGVTGHSVVKLLLAQPFPRLIVLDTASFAMESAPDDMDTVTAYCIHYQDGATSYRQRIEQVSPVAWQILDQVETKTGWNTTAVTPWVYPFAPVAENQNLPHPMGRFGLPDLGPDIIQINKDLNFIASNIQRIIKFHAHPKTYVTGLNGNKLNIAADETIILPEGATMGALEMQGDLASSMEFAERLVMAMEVLSGVPAIAIGNAKDAVKGPMSGVALKILYQPLLDKTETKRRLYGDMLVELCRRMLAIGGFGPDIQVTIEWDDPLPTDELVQAQIGQLELAMGASPETVFRRRLDLDYADEVEKKATGPQDLDDTSGEDPQLTDTGEASPANAATDTADSDPASMVA